MLRDDMAFRAQRLEYYFSLTLMALLFFSNVFTTIKIFFVAFFLTLSMVVRRHKFLDINFCLLLGFLSLYFLNMLAFGEEFGIEALPLVLFPLVAYLTGKWVGFFSRDARDLLYKQITVGCSLAFFTVLSIGLSVHNYGFYGMARGVALIGLDNGQYSATVLGGFLIFLTAISGTALSVSPRLSACGRAFIVILSLIGIFCAVRLGSRTHLGVFFASVLIGYYINRHYMTSTWRYFLYSLAAFFIVYTFWFINDESIMLSYYADRLNNSEVGISTFGGRTEKWGQSLGLLLSSPMGWGLNETGYAHNLWLDAARKGGWWTLICLLLLTWTAVKSLCLAFSQNSNPLFRSIIACIGAGYFLLFSVEPILDGYHYSFAAFFAFLGGVNGFRDRTRRI
ncbi:hypothetical protein V0R52_14880 [Pseudomonas asiatica]|uniref:hypothetical protein n=1 Tax=Pseudomonas asiatica TaxID=2219225 RepID=UPI002E7BA3BB|nr:hypothetical protein [Pseudomonas asiatica]MEE1917681.1 hypothetical protein [Pseudomonas asiatica]